MRSPRLTVLTAGALLATAAPLGAVIIPQHGMGGVRVGETLAQVTKDLGGPVHLVKGVNDFGPYTELRYRGFTVTLQGGQRVSAVSTRARLQRTRGGIGVGSTETALKARIPAVRCTTLSGFRSCTLGREEVGRRVTSFFIRKGRVSSVIIGDVLD